ncbi:MAG: RNA-binding protein [Micrococcales bacterium 73-15]|uniref:RNA-binding S4 domain-containing protein n=1 Tax=Salana multivorans TaxID=120377 RepID=UPI000960A8C1|nr:RNA-binding S4 domain-containing protein [Salana multivorans]OJX95595.1 MAG: RNA-binding protein [Micrococcales bacterium 73-15]
MTKEHATTTEVPIRDETIRLGQLLKLAGVVDDGTDAKFLLADEAVRVNGEVDERRGRQVRRGDTVEVSLPRGVVVVRVTGG